MEKRNEVLELSFDFALSIIKYCEELGKNKKYVIAQQLLKSGSSIGANVREAQNSESRLDFIHKIKVAAKEADETEYWLLLCQKAENYSSPDDLLQKLYSIKRLLNTIIVSAKRNLNNS